MNSDLFRVASLCEIVWLCWCRPTNLQAMMSSEIQAVTDFIFYSTPISEADIILVPGGHPRQLMERAAELYHAGYARIVLPSGGKSPWFTDGKTEWEFLKEVALDLDIPEEAILREDRASNTFENAKFSLDVLRTARIQVKRAIIVCKAFHARRALITYQRVFPAGTRIMVSPVNDERDIRSDNWHTSPEKTQMVKNEVKKIFRYFGVTVPSCK